jgi:hypothetical protein
VGAYQLDKGSLVKNLIFDLDPKTLHNPREIASKILAACFGNSTRCDDGKPRVFPKAVLLEASRFPDLSYHIYVLFEVPIPADVASWLGDRLLKLADIDPKTVEVFPKQDQLTADHPYGNFVKLPLGLHKKAGKWSHFLDFETFQPLPASCILNVQGLHFTDEDIEKIQSQLTKTHVQTGTMLPDNFKPLTDAEEEATVKFLCKYWREGYRNRLEMSFLGLCLKKGVNHESAKRIVSEVVSRTGDNEGQSRLELVDYHYRNRRNNQLKGSSGIREIIEELKRNESAR